MTYAGKYVFMTEAEFKSLPKYDTSLPTGTTIGKKWKAERPARPFRTKGDPFRTYLCEYYELNPPEFERGEKLVGISHHQIIIQSEINHMTPGG